MGSPFTFLIIEDDESIRFLHRRALEKHFPESTVMVAETAAKGLALAASERFDAIMTDHKLPDASGVELIAKIRATGFAGPVLLVTGNDDPKVHAGAMAAGATKVLSGTRPGFAEAFATLLPSAPPTSAE